MQHVCTPYCPEYCPFEPTYVDPCPSSECSGEQTCVQILTSDQVLYMKSDLLNYNIQPEDSLTTIVNKLVALLYPNCFGVFDDTFDNTFN